MKTSTLFVIGLLAGAVLVFGIRAATLGESIAAESTDPVEEGHTEHAEHTEHAGPAYEGHVHVADEQPPAPPSTPTASSTLVVRLDDAGRVVGAVMEMPGGSSHEVVPGDHAPMGDYPARIEGSASLFTAHLHPRDDGTLEVKLRDPDGVVMAEGVLAASDERPPENAICPVMGNPVDPEVYVDYEGRRIGFCCSGCDEEFLANPEKYLKKVDAELAAKGTAPAEDDPDRPPENAICPVMGNPVDPEIYVDYEGRRIGFCCPGCDGEFLSNPERYLKKVDAELAGKEPK